MRTKYFETIRLLAIALTVAASYSQVSADGGAKNCCGNGGQEICRYVDSESTCSESDGDAGCSATSYYSQCCVAACAGSNN